MSEDTGLPVSFRLESGHMVVPRGLAALAEKLGVDIIYIDDDSSVLTYTIGEADWKSLPPEEDKPSNLRVLRGEKKNDIA